MNLISALKPGRLGKIGFILGAFVYTAVIPAFLRADTNAPVAQSLELKVAAAKPPDPAKKPEKKKLTGAELYQVNCNRCHAERYPTEFTQTQWKTIMIHMRVRANLPAAQAREILKYLQEDSGN
jgi:mono/diheme cytochrome c family protein